MKRIKVRLTFLEDVLGTAPNNQEIHAEFIAKNAPDAQTRQEEIEAIGADEYREKQMTVFPRGENGMPIFWDYQIKGFFKDACSALQRMKGEKISQESCKIKAYKKVIDGDVHVFPRRIAINLNGEIGNLQRPLRAQTAQGERIALADSETIPAGSTITCDIETSANFEKAVIEWLKYGRYKGLGQWRNAGFGRFKYDLLETEDFEEYAEI